MRLVLTIRDADVLTVELHWPGKTSSDDGPKLQANGSADTERAEPYGDPDTRVMFGFGRPES
jgi:hypothetical protein